MFKDWIDRVLISNKFTVIASLVLTITILLLLFLVSSFLIMLLWNYVIVYFGAKTIGFGVACGICLIVFILGKIGKWG